MKTLTPAFVKAQKKKNVKTWRKVILEEISTDAQVDITEYVENVSKVEQQIEEKFCEFIPTTVTFTVTDKETQDYDFFTQGETTGFFDKLIKATVQGYKIILKEGIDGIADEIVSFDGEVDIESVHRIDRQTIVFTATGWLRDAGRYDASIISDPDNPPFKNVTGITVNYPGGGIQGVPGGKYIETGGKTGSGIEEKCWISYNGGKKEWLTYPGGNTFIYEPNYKGKMWITYTLADIPEEPAKDYFSVRMYEGALIACGYYEHIPIEEAVDLICDEWWGEGVGTRDIQVEEIGGGILEKHFIYLAPIYDAGNKSDVKITASKVISYAGNLITMLVAIEWKKADNTKIYKVVIDVNARTRTVTEMAEWYAGVRVARFFNANGRWWGLVGQEVTGILGKEWYGVAFYKFNVALTGIELVRNIPFNHTLPGWYHYNLYSFTLKNEGVAGSKDFYCIRQNAEAGMVYTVKLYKYDINADTWTSVVTMINNAVAYNKGTWAILEGNIEYYYFACKKYIGGTIVHTTSYIMAYKMTGVPGLTEITTFTSSVSTVISDCYWRQKIGSPNSVFLKFEDPSSELAYKLHHLLYEIIPNGDKIKYFGGNNLFDDRYTAWRYEDDQWRIMFFYGSFYFGGNVQTEDILDSDYVGNIIHPRIFKDFGSGNYYYCGFVTDESNRVIPFLYIKETTTAHTIKELDLTDWTIWEALKYLAQGFLCYFVVPEYQKIQFYHRKKNKGVLTLVKEDYKKQPNMRIYNNFADGVHIENSKYELSEKRGNTLKKSKVFAFDNRLTSEDSIGIVADWYYAFLVTDGRRKEFEVVAPFRIEIEPMDKVTLILYDRFLNTFWTKETLVYETSSEPWVNKEAAHDVILKLIEKEGEGDIHELIPERRSVSV